MLFMAFEEEGRDQNPGVMRGAADGSVSRGSCRLRAPGWAPDHTAAGDQPLGTPGGMNTRNGPASWALK